MRVLLIAEQADPETVSVPLEGWSHANAIRQRYDALIVTQIRHRDVFTRHGLAEGRDFLAIDSEAIARPAWKLGELLRGGRDKGWTTAMAAKLPAYLYFERLLWTRLADRILEGEFDLVHRITPLSPTLPSPLARRCHSAGVPFILGPINGGVPWPKGHNRTRIREREWLSFTRDAHRLVPWHGATRRFASAIIAGSLDTLDDEPLAYRDRTYYIPENAVDPARFTSVRKGRAADSIRIIFVGRLVPYKGCDILVEAASELLRAGRATLTIVGDGPQRKDLTKLVAELGIGTAVAFKGWLPHDQVARVVAGADLFAFPSIREFGGAVAVESMAVGVPPMVVRYGGLAETVTEEVGFPVELGSREELITRFRARLEAVAADPEQIDARGSAGRRRVLEYFTWDAKAAQVARVYEKVISGRPCARNQVPMSADAENRLEAAFSKVHSHQP